MDIIITFLISMFVSFVLGTVANVLSPIKMPGSWAGAIFAGFLGSWIGQTLLGTWGPAIASFSLIPSLIGSIAVAAAVGYIAEKL